MFEDYSKEIEEITEEAKKEVGWNKADELIDKIEEFINNHPYVPIAGGVIVGFTLYKLGFKKGIKKGRIEYITHPDIPINADAIFDKAASILDLADEIKTFSAEKITKF